MRAVSGALHAPDTFAQRADSALCDFFWGRICAYTAKSQVKGYNNQVYTIVRARCGALADTRANSSAGVWYSRRWTIKLLQFQTDEL